MDLSWLQSTVLGFLSGLTDILPVCAQAHKAILLKMFGSDVEPPVMRLMIHLATLAALYYCCSAQIMRMNRQLKLAKVPKKRRKRPVDVRVIMDFRLLRVTLIPLVLAYLIYSKTSVHNMALSWIALYTLLNAVILYLPVLLPTGNKDSRTFSPFEGILMGLGASLSVIPGVSAIGSMNAVGSLCGGDRTYVLNMSFLVQMAVTLLLIVYDVMLLLEIGAGTISFAILLSYLLSAAAAFAGVFLGVRVMRALAANVGFNGFAYYSLGLALFTFILYLQA